MRAPLSWIREFTPLDAPVVEIADALGQLGLEVEAIDDPGASIRGVVAARILDVVPHPDADRIRLADIDFGGGQLRVVCGAPNIEPGMVVPFAAVGAVLPGDFEITRRKIRGVVSEGMLCSARELGLGDDHSGILGLPGDSPLGEDIRPLLGLDDVVFELAITPNRPDAMGIVGVARDLAAHFGLPLDAMLPEPDDAVASIADPGGAVVVEVEAPGRCPRFVAQVAAVTLGESPAWMQRRLVQAGMRPINNVVDVTNYVMLERCRPLHAFDLDRLGGRGIVVRVARDGEQIVTLDGVTRTLTGADLLICDAERTPHAIAGIMGGRDAEVDETTTTILLESAYFTPAGIGRTSKRIGLRSEASARFERGIDPNGTAAGAQYAMRLLQEVAGAQRVAGTIDQYPEPIVARSVTLRTSRVNRILGTHLEPAAVRELIEPLGITVEATDDPSVFTAACPTFRPDLEREIDLVEEVARRVGLDSIARSVASAPAGSVGRLTPRQRDRRTISDALVGAGAFEALTMPLVSPADLAGVGAPTQGVVEVTNPLRAEESVLRTSLRPGLLAAVARNAAHGEPDVRFFELGTVFFPPRAGATLPIERDHLGFVASGQVRGAPRRDDRPIDVGDALDALQSVIDALALTGLRVVNAPEPGFEPGRSGTILADGHRIGAVGAFAEEACAAMDAPPCVGFELDASALYEATRSARLTEPVSTYPPALIDLAFVVERTVAAGDVEATLRREGGPLLERVQLFDVFTSDALGAGAVSLAFALRFRAPDRTLGEHDVAALRQQCIDAVVGTHGARLRG